MKILFILALCFIADTSIYAKQQWFPITVNAAENPLDKNSQTKRLTYTPLEKSSSKWNICVSFPHLKDDYWLSVNYGIFDESKRLGIEMELYEAGGYPYLEKQIQQIRDCIDNGVDALVVAGIDKLKLNPVIEYAFQKSIPVIDLVNGLSSIYISARSLVSFYDMGYATGTYLASKYKSVDRKVRILWYPGPNGAGWVDAGNRGFIDAVRNTNINIIETQYGDVGRKEQSLLVKNGLEKYGNIDAIVGTSATALASVKLLRNLPADSRPEVMSYYMTRAVYNAILRKQILAAPTAQAVIQGRIAIDQATRILEKKPYLYHAGPLIHIIDQKNINSIQTGNVLAPNGFKAQLTVK